MVLKGIGIMRGWSAILRHVILMKKRDAFGVIEKKQA
jgi:hypothetical protein